MNAEDYWTFTADGYEIHTYDDGIYLIEKIDSSGTSINGTFVNKHIPIGYYYSDADGTWDIAWTENSTLDPNDNEKIQYVIHSASEHERMKQKHETI